MFSKAYVSIAGNLIDTLTINLFDTKLLLGNNYIKYINIEALVHCKLGSGASFFAADKISIKEFKAETATSLKVIKANTIEFIDFTVSGTEQEKLKIEAITCLTLTTKKGTFKHVSIANLTVGRKGNKKYDSSWVMYNTTFDEMSLFLLSVNGEVLVCGECNVEALKVRALVLRRFSLKEYLEQEMENSLIASYGRNRKDWPFTNPATGFRRMAENNQLTFHTRFFQIHEQKALNKSLKQSGHFFTRLPLLLSKYTNRYGRNWVIPLVLVLGTSFVFYALAYWLNAAPANVSGFLNSLKSGKLAIFVLPTHRLSTVFGSTDSINGWVYVIDTVQRITASFLIFQFIRAFRFNFIKR